MIRQKLTKPVWVIYRRRSQQFIGLKQLGTSVHQFGYGLVAFDAAIKYNEKTIARATLRYLRTTAKQRKLNQRQLAQLCVRRATVTLLINLTRTE